MNFEQYINETLNEAKKPVEMINESEALVVLGGLTAALFAVGGPMAAYAIGMNGSLKKSFNEIVKNFRYKSLNKKATALINSDEEVQQAFKAYTKAPKGQKLKSLKSFMELLGTKLDTDHRGLLQKVIGDLKAEYRKQDKKLNEGLKQARKNVGAETCWDGYRVDGTKKNDKGEEVPNCVPKNESIETVGKPKFDVDTYVVYDIGEDKYEVRISKIKDGNYTLSDILKNGEEEKGTLSKPVEWIDTNAKVLK